MIRAGANRVVAPTIIGGHRMAMALTKPAVGDFLDSVTANHLELGFEQLEVDPISTLVNRKLSETVIRSELNIVIVSIRRNDGEIIFNPSGETKNRRWRHAYRDRQRGIVGATECPCTRPCGRTKSNRGRDEMKVLVTGGSGYLGTYVRQFFEADDFSRRSGFDILDYQAVERVADYDAVIHLAAHFDKSPEGAFECFRTNAEGTANVIRNMNPGSVFIYASTKDVYGVTRARVTLLTKNTSTDYCGQTAFEWSKLIGERYVEYYARTERYSGLHLPALDCLRATIGGQRAGFRHALR